MAVWVVRLLDEADPAAVSESRFADIDATSFHAPFVERMAELGITQGCGDGSRFCPDGTVSRAQMAVFLSRAFDLPEAGDPGFSDVASDAWYGSDVARLAASGITQGCGDGSRFCPSRDTTRAEMAAFLWRAANQAVQATLPAAIGESVSVGWDYSCAVRADYTVTCWGRSQSNPRAGRFLTVSAGVRHTCGVRIDQTVDCWGESGFLTLPHLAHLYGTASPPGSFLSTSSGHDVSCGLKTDQTIVCWGSGSGAPKGRFLSVSTGYDHSCGVRTDESVACWAQRSLFIRDANNEIVAGVASGGALHAPEGRFLSVSAGGNFSCGLRVSEIVECWRLDGEDLPAPEGRFLSVSSGRNLSCGVRTDETLECWDFSRDGAPSGEFLSLANDCGIRSDRTIACWGVDWYDRFYERSAPSGTFSSFSERKWGHTSLWFWCGIRTDRTLACWREYGKEVAVPSGEFLSIDIGDEACAVRADQTVVCFPRYDLSGDAPAGRFLSLSPTRYERCGVRIDQTVTCWYFDSHRRRTEVHGPPGRFLSLSGYCGIRSDETLYCSDDEWETELEVPPGRFLSVDTHPRSWRSHEACGIRADRTVTCWAYKDGKLTDLQDEAVPGRFLSVEMIHDERRSRVSYRCGIRVDRTLACWGLGDVVGPPSGPYLAPIYRDGIPTFVWMPSSDFLAAEAAAGGETVSAGRWHSCGVRADRTIACWGSNHLVRSSFPAPTGQASPTIGRFLAVSSGSYHSCGLRADLVIRCWGSSGVTTRSTFPNVVTSLEAYAPSDTFLSVSAGGDHSCGVRVDQTVTCWGSNQDRHGKHVGQAVVPSGRFLSVTAGHRHSCALGTDRAVTCWGDNTSGWPVDEAECIAWTGGGAEGSVTGLPFGHCDQLSSAQRPPGQSDPPAGRFLVPLPTQAPQTRTPADASSNVPSGHPDETTTETSTTTDSQTNEPEQQTPNILYAWTLNLLRSGAAQTRQMLDRCRRLRLRRHTTQRRIQLPRPRPHHRPMRTRRHPTLPNQQHTRPTRTIHPGHTDLLSIRQSLKATLGRHNSRTSSKMAEIPPHTVPRPVECCLELAGSKNRKSGATPTGGFGRGRDCALSGCIGLAVFVVAPAGGVALLVEGAVVERAGGDGGVWAGGCVGLSYGVVAPASDGSAGGDGAGVSPSRRDRGVGICGWVGLARAVVSPTLDRAVSGDRAVMESAGCDRGVDTCGWVGLVLVVVAPASDGSVGGDGAGVSPSCCERGVGACGWAGLAVVVVSPAVDAAGLTEGTCVEPSRCHGGVGACGWAGLAVVVVSPAVDAAGLTEGTCVEPSRCHGGVGACGWAGLAVVVVSPAVDAAGLTEGTCVEPSRRHSRIDGRFGLGCFDDAGSPGQEGGHLRPGDRSLGAVTEGVCGAADGYPSRGEGVDAGRMSVGGRHIDEPGRRGGGKVESPGEEGGHLRPGDRSLGAVA